MTILSLIVAITLVIINVNEFLIIPSWLIYLCFGISVTCILFKTIAYFYAKNQFNKMNKKFVNSKHFFK